MIKIEIPAADISIKQRKQVIEGDEAVIPEIYGFIDFHLIPVIKAASSCFTMRMMN